MGNNLITLRLNKRNQKIVELLKTRKKNQSKTDYILEALELYNFCNGSNALPIFQLSPSYYKKKLENESADELLKLKKNNEDFIIEQTKWFDLNQIKTGINKTDINYWFVPQYSPLGWISLYTEYNKVIDSILEERKNKV